MDSLGAVLCGSFRYGLAGMVRLVQEHHGTARFVKVWQAMFGPARNV